MRSTLSRLEAVEKEVNGRTVGQVAPDDLLKISRAVELLFICERSQEDNEELAAIDAYFLGIGERSVSEIFGHLMATV